MTSFWCEFLSCVLVILILGNRGPQPKVDANQIVADAFCTEATWQAFPGFVADLEIESDGKVSQGRLVVERDGRLYVESVPEIHRAWALERLGCVVRQRFPNDAENKTWMFVHLTEERTPLGQAFCRTDAPFGPYHWIQNRQFQAVDIDSAHCKERLTTLRTERNPDNKHLPFVQVLHRWNRHTLELVASETTVLSWQRLGGFDLPATIQVLSAGNAVASTHTIGRLVLTQVQLFSTPKAIVASQQRGSTP